MRTATFALFAGFAYLSAGLLGLVPAALEPAPPDMPPVRFSTLHGYLLGLFPVNVVHSAVHLAIGAAGVYAWRSDHTATHGHAQDLRARFSSGLRSARAPWRSARNADSFGLAPLHGNDVWLHAGTAAIAAYFRLAL